MHSRVPSNGEEMESSAAPAVEMTRDIQSRDLSSGEEMDFFAAPAPMRKVSFGGLGSKVQELNDESYKLRKENTDLKQLTENMQVSKLLLVQSCSDEIERLRAIISSLEDDLRSIIIGYRSKN